MQLISFYERTFVAVHKHLRYMNTVKHIFLCLGASLFAMVHLGAQELEGSHTLDNGIKMSLYDDATATVKDGKNCTGDISIPKIFSTNGRTYTVTGIEATAFAGNKNITYIILPSTLKKIGGQAFKDCTKLKDFLQGPEIIESIDYSPFDNTAWLKSQQGRLVYFKGWIVGTNFDAGQYQKDCNILEGTIGMVEGCPSINAYNIYLPKTFKHVTANMSGYATQKFIVDDDNPTLMSDSYGAIYSRKKVSYLYSDQQQMSISVTGQALLCTPWGNNNAVFRIAPGTKTIEKNALYRCQAKQIIIPEGVQYILEGAFEDLANCEIIDLPASVDELTTSFFNYKGAIIFRTQYYMPGSSEKNFRKCNEATLYIHETAYVRFVLTNYKDKFKAVKYIENGVPSLYEAGDVNHDGTINSADVVAIYNFIVQGKASGITQADADVNTDNAVNATDITTVYNIISGN